MVDAAEKNTPEQLELKQKMASQGALTAIYNTKEINQSQAALEGVVKFSDGQGDYKSYKEFGKTPLAAENINQVEITTKDANGNPKVEYYKKIAEEGTAVNTNGGKHGFKALAWVQTDAAGEPIKNENAKQNVILAFPGYSGNPLSDTSDTRSMYAVGDAKLYPPTAEVKAFVENAKANAGGDFNASVVGHSMGSNNAMVATLACKCEGVDVKSTTLIEPVGANRSWDLAKKAFKEGETLSEEQKALKNAFADYPAADIAGHCEQAEKSFKSIRMIDKNKKGLPLSNSALLEGDPNPETQAATKQRNLVTSGVPSAGWVTGRKGEVSIHNLPVGEEFYIDVTGRKNNVTSLAAKVDPTHSLGNAVSAANDNAPFIEREKANALAPQEKQKESQEAETSPSKDEPTRKTSAIDSPFKLNFNLIASDLGLRLPENLNQSGYGTEAHGLSEAVRKAADHSKGSGLA